MRCIARQHAGVTHAQHLGRLCPRCERPRCRCAAEQRNKSAPLLPRSHSFPSSPPPFAERVLRNIESALPRQFDLMLAATITLPHLLASSEMSLPKSAGEPASTVPPRLASRALSFGSAMLILTSLFSLSMSSAGVLFGAPMPNHALAS